VDIIIIAAPTRNEIELILSNGPSKEYEFVPLSQ
jgi:hypothetical protein